MTKRRRAFLEQEISRQRVWIVGCGGTLAGYIAHYGDPGLPICYGSGGTRIYEADCNRLRDLEQRLAGK